MKVLEDDRILWFVSLILFILPILVETTIHDSLFLAWCLYLIPVYLVTSRSGLKDGIAVILIGLTLHALWRFNFQGSVIDKVDWNIFISVILAQIAMLFGVNATQNKLLSQQMELEVVNAELKDKSNRLEDIAYRDSLTGLPNRLALEMKLKDTLNHSLASGEEVAILYINLDRFHTVNDVLGHSNGDYLLQESAKRIQECVMPAGITVRHAGDEFIVLLPSTSAQKGIKITKDIIQAFVHPFMVNEEEVIISLSIGLCMNSEVEKMDDVDTMIRFANQAMYQAKNRGVEHFAVFNGQCFERIDRKSFLEQSLKKAIENEELNVHYQPLVDLQTKRIVGTEALLRWNHPQLGNIAPFEFIPIAEETGMIVDIGKWVMEEACRKTKEWHDAGYPIHVAVNVSLRQTWQREFVEQVRQTLLRTGLEPSYLKIEITESMMHNVIESSRILKELKEVGVSLSLDDFGTGYASLSVLGDLPFDYLKIDRSFIKDIPENPRSRAITNRIVELGRSLGFTIVGEGIENAKHLEYLKKQGCQLGQGYHFSKPIPAHELEELLMLPEEERFIA